MTLGEDLGFAPNRRTYKPDTRLVIPDCYLGLEFEFEKVRDGGALPPNEPWAAYWLPKRDGSLHDQGMEFVFIEPLFGKDALDAVEGLLSYANARRWAVNIRTGLHVHHDARNMTQEQLMRECVLYALFEKSIYNYVGNNREENVFCMPWFASYGATRAVKAIITARNGELLRTQSEKIADEKYAGLNLDTLARFGSVEWRHALATKESGNVLRWINLVLRFKEAAMRMAHSGTELVRAAKKDTRALARLVLQDQMPLLDGSTLVEDVLDYGVPTALDLVSSSRVLNPNMDWINATPKEKTAVGKSFMAWAATLKEKKHQSGKSKISGGIATLDDNLVVDDHFRLLVERTRQRAELIPARLIPPPRRRAR